MPLPWAGAVHRYARRRRSCRSWRPVLRRRRWGPRRGPKRSRVSGQRAKQDPGHARAPGSRSPASQPRAEQHRCQQRHYCVLSQERGVNRQRGEARDAERRDEPGLQQHVERVEVMFGRPNDPLLPEIASAARALPLAWPFCALIGSSPASTPWPRRGPPEIAARSSAAPSFELFCPAHSPSLPTTGPRNRGHQ